jgi:hydrogenase maturation protease
MPAGKFRVGYFPAGEFFSGGRFAGWQIAFPNMMAQEFPVTPDAELLVIGYGNSLRHDDGAGPRVAEAIEALNLPGVRTLVSQQLSPEHAEPVARARRVIFVDAAVDQVDGVKFRQLVPGETTQLMAHAADPRTMLALARDVFGHVPEAWWLTIPALKLGFGTDFSPEAEAGVQTAVEKIKRMISANFCQDTGPASV